MQFYGDEIDGFPELSYIAVIGPMKNELASKIVKRAKRIKKANPQKNKLALDIRGLGNIKNNHQGTFKKLKTELNQMEWSFYICNIPKQNHEIFLSKNFQKDLNIFQNKQDLLDHLENKKQPKKNKKKIEPLKVGIRTVEGVRLFEGEAVRFDKEQNRLSILTSDKNAQTLTDKKQMEAEIFFKTQKIQILPHDAELSKCKETKKRGFNYRLKAELKDLNKADRETLIQHYQV